MFRIYKYIIFHIAPFKPWFIQTITIPRQQRGSVAVQTF